ncbi:hypothetical protein [Treponema pedis]|uniref:hypothetical protein n=1 Tax=Treponema pedis TaxID=409322 RepID=UPI001980DA39|nr:hypothetical protein [Treponema pedis]QSI05426.1 hypothetical protein DYQ05_11125 [Treponema pedis]
MIERCLFLPDNLMAILSEEQRLIQSLLNFPFRKTVPVFKTSQEHSLIEILPPVSHKGLIIRPCVNSFKFNEIEGFVLGQADSFADYILSQINNLKLKTLTPVFTVLRCKAWYYADFDFFEDETSGLCRWTVQNKVWKKRTE